MPLIAGKRANSVNGHTLVRPIEIGVRESSWLADADGGVTRVVELCERFDETEASGLALGRFLERTLFQRGVAERTGGGPGGLGGGHAVAIGTLEVTPWGAFLAREPYEASAAALVTGKTRLRGDALQEIISGVVSALGIFAVDGARRHGALTPEAVLIGGGTPGRLRIGLHRPADSESFGALTDPAGDEMRRLGRLIFELVLHRPFREMGGYPVRDGPEWSSLGKTGGFWLGLVNELLDPSGCRLSLGDITTRLGGIRYRTEGPGLGVYAARAGVGAAVLAAVAGSVFWFVKPRPQRVLKEFTNSEFETWVRASPVVASLRGAVGEDAPAVLRAALAELEITPADRKELGLNDKFADFFSIPVVFRTSGMDFRAAMDAPLPSLMEQVDDFVQSALGERVGENPGPPPPGSDLHTVQQFAGLYLEGLERYTGGDGRLGMLGVFSTDAWPARGLIENISAADQGEWLHASARDLLADRLEAVESWLSLNGSGVDGSFPLDRVTAREPLAAGSVEGVGAFVDAVGVFVEAVGEIEAAAGDVKRWRNEVYPAIETGSVAIASAAPWPVGLDQIASAAIGGESDPFLDSFAAVPEIVGVAAPGETVEDLDARFEAAAGLVADVGGFIDARWKTGGVDLIELEEWTAQNRGRLLAEADTSDPSSMAAWIDARVELGQEWLAVAGAAGLVPESEWPRSGIDAALREVKDNWADASATSPELAGEAEVRDFGALGGINTAISSIESTLARMRGVPRWAALRDDVEATREAVESDFADLSRRAGRIYAEVMKPPREMIEAWQGGPPDFGPEGSVFLAARARLGGPVIGAWEAWAADPSLDDDALRRADETGVMRTGLDGIDRVLVNAASRLERILDQSHSFGGYPSGEIMAGARPLVASALTGSLLAEGAWGERAASEPGGAFESLLDGVEAEWIGLLSALDVDLGALAQADAGIARGFAPGESFDLGVVAAGRDLVELVDRLRGEYSGPIGGVAEIETALRSAEALVAVGVEQDADRLLGVFIDESAARPGVAVAAFRRLDAIARQDSVWPGSVGDLDTHRQPIQAALRGLRAELSEQDWVRLESGESPRGMRGIVQGWWLRGVGLAGTPTAFATAVEGAADWFGDVDNGWDNLLDADLLSGRSRYNARSVQVRAAIRQLASVSVAEAEKADKSTLAGIETRLRQDLGAALQRLRQEASVSLDDRERRSALGWVTAMEAALANAAQGRRGWDAADHGPVGADLPGWRVAVDEDAVPPRVVYTKAATGTTPTLSIVFHLIDDLPSGGQVFLAEDEVSVGLAGDFLLSAGRALRESPLLDWFSSEVDERQLDGNQHPAPFSRTLRRNLRRPSRPFQIALRDQWLTGSEYGPAVARSSFPAYPADLRGANEGVISADQGTPHADHPLTFVPGASAAAIADAVGCRLPTVEEFNAALRSAAPFGGPESGRWNVRDRSFVLQRDHVNSALQPPIELTHYTPGKSSYDGTEGGSGAVWHTSVGADLDNKLWFYKTGTEGPDGAFQSRVRFKHLIGNVAEFVSLNGESDLASLRVVGASALSDPSVRHDQLMSAGRRRDYVGRNGFVDVGFRLAIDADDFGSLGKLVQKEIDATVAAAFVSGDRE